MNLLDRPLAPDPYDLLPAVPSFTVTSHDLTDGQPLPDHFTATGGNISPHLAWTGFPPETRSFAVTCFDPDAPTPSGWWHWVLVDLEPTRTQLPQGAGTSDLTIEGPAYHLRGDGGEASYQGAAPPAGDRAHRYIFVVHALDVDTLPIDEDTSPAMCAFQTLFHGIARARLTATYQNLTQNSW